MRRFAWLFLASVGLAAAAQAQRQIPVGVRVKIVLDEQERQANNRIWPRLVIRGELTARSADSLWIRPTPFTGVVAVPKPAIRRIHESRGVPSRIAAMFIDGIGGAVIGAIEFTLFGFATNYDRFGNSATEAAVHGAAVGAVVGGFLGLVLPVERWRLRSLDAQ